jgi:hypothetical protein
MEREPLGTAGRRGARCAGVDLDLPRSRLQPIQRWTPCATELQNFTLIAAEM